MEQLSFFKDPDCARCNICKCKIVIEILVFITTCDGEYGYVEFCNPCILKKFEEAENKLRQLGVLKPAEP